MPSPNEITVAQLSRLVGTPDAPLIVDLCIDEDFALDPRLIPGAFRHPFSDVANLAPHIQGQRVVMYCQKGKKISMGAAALLRTCGVAAEYLSGGQIVWRDAGLPLVPSQKIPVSHSMRGADQYRSPTLWVTRHRPKIDRIACPWLIRRFIDPQARFLFVAPAEVLNVAERFSATAFDVEDVFWSHRKDFCTFDTMLVEFELNLPALENLATIIRAADTDSLHLAPQAAGLLAVSLGLSRMYRDDLAQLEAGMSIYDAFYRWARDATDEGHDWPTSGSGPAKKSRPSN